MMSSVTATASRRPPDTKSLYRLLFRVCIVAAAISVFLPNTLLSIATLATLILLWNGAFRTTFRIIVAATISIQWIQVSSLVWIGNLTGVELTDPLGFNSPGPRAFEPLSQTPTAVLLGLSGLLAINYTARFFEPKRWPRLMPWPQMNARTQALAYCLLVIVPGLLLRVVPAGLFQPVLVLYDLRFVFAITIFYHVMNGNKQYNIYLVGLIMFELLSGFLGFFSSFREILVVLAIAVLVFGQSFGRKTVRYMVLISIFTICLGVVWTAIKPQYRSTLNAGTATQQVLISSTEAANALTGYIAELDGTALSDASLNLALRLAYVDFFARVLDTVPGIIPHTSGSLWGGAVMHTLTPRILFPDKAILESDSERTIKYTGLLLASGDQGTSISIGWAGESYIDFGRAGVPLMGSVLGLFIALSARLLCRVSQNGHALILIAVFIIVLLPMQQFEISNIKLVAGLAWRVIVGSLFLAVGMGLLLQLFPASAPRSRRSIQPQPPKARAVSGRKPPR